MRVREIDDNEGARLVRIVRRDSGPASTDPYYAGKKARAEHLYTIADREVISQVGEPEIILRGRLRRTVARANVA